jgi:hypothetical protein
LRDHASTLVGIGLVDRDVDRLLPQTLDEAATDRGILDQKRGRTIAPLNLHYLALEGVKRKPPTDHLKNVEDLPTLQQHHTSRIVAGFGLAQRDVPARDDTITGLMIDVVIGRQPFPLDNGAPGWDWALLVLR